MTGYKELKTIVPDWAKWQSIDSEGWITVHDTEPNKARNGLYWVNDGGHSMPIGQGPPPKDWTEELYQLV